MTTAGGPAKADGRVKPDEMGGSLKPEGSVEPDGPVKPDGSVKARTAALSVVSSSGLILLKVVAGTITGSVAWGGGGRRRWCGAVAWGGGRAPARSFAPIRGTRFVGAGELAQNRCEYVLFRDGGRSHAAVMPPDRPGPHREWRFSSESPNPNAKARVAARASTQFGRIRFDQLRGLGVGKATISDWRGAGYLHWELPRVYAVGHPGRSTESDLAAALLYAGPGAMLSHATALWWLELLKFPPRQINVSTPRRIRSRGNIVVHGRRNLERTWRPGPGAPPRALPVTTATQAILDFAATGRPDLLRLVLANADYDGKLDVETLMRSDCPALRKALAIHQPALARARSDLEILLITFCETQQLPIPQTNEYIHGWLVDAVWPGRRLVVEVDGIKGHRTRAQLERDHQRDLELRAAGYIVLRYTERQLLENPAAVAADIRRYL